MTKTSRAHQQAPEQDSIPDLRYVDVGDAKIAYRVVGGRGPVVFVLQPFWTASDDTIADRRNFVELLCRSHRVVVHDRRGAGASDRRPEQISMDLMVADVAAVLTDAGVERAILLGIGEAASLAVHVAVQRPDRVERLVLVDPLLRPMNGPGSSMLVYALRNKGRAGLRTLARTMVTDDHAADVLGIQMARTVDGPVAAGLYDAFITAGTEEVLSQVAAPALFAYGVTDGVVSEDEANGLQGRMADARIGFVDGPAGSDTALNQAWVQIRNFIDDGITSIAPDPFPDNGRPVVEPQPDPAPRRAPRARQSAPRTAPAVVDYVPSGMPPRGMQRQRSSEIVAQTLAPSVMAQHGQGAGHRPATIAWGPPVGIPPKAVQLNREGINRLLMGDIEEALVLFQRAIEIAPHYEDAAVNHRELLSRLVQRRVAEWQTRQAEQAMAESERRAAQWAQRAARGRRGPFSWLFRAPTSS